MHELVSINFTTTIIWDDHQILYLNPLSLPFILWIILQTAMSTVKFLLWGMSCQLLHDNYNVAELTECSDLSLFGSIYLMNCRIRLIIRSSMWHEFNLSLALLYFQISLVICAYYYANSYILFVLHIIFSSSLTFKGADINECFWSGLIFQSDTRACSIISQSQVCREGNAIVFLAKHSRLLPHIVVDAVSLIERTQVRLNADFKVKSNRHCMIECCSYDFF